MCCFVRERKALVLACSLYDMAEPHDTMVNKAKVSQAGKSIPSFWNEETAKLPLTELTTSNDETK